MKISDNSIDRLRGNINRMIENNKRLTQENEQLSKLCLRQGTELEEIKIKLEESQAKLNAVMLAESIIEVSGGTKIARQRVNNLLRDIDRCIALVNK